MAQKKGAGSIPPQTLFRLAMVNWALAFALLTSLNKQDQQENRWHQHE
ncbi:hypothetical protein D082_04190 [Synechocystis sp. PCC 6714]|nr:hypothetical protein D082_04190 [Synechocystis sp. PCC 6714]